MKIVQVNEHNFCVVDTNSRVVISADSVENLYVKALDIMAAFKGATEDSSQKITDKDTELAMALLNNTFEVDKPQ